MFFHDFPNSDYHAEIDPLKTGDPEVQFVLRLFLVFQYICAVHPGTPGHPDLMLPEI